MRSSRAATLARTHKKKNRSDSGGAASALGALRTRFSARSGRPGAGFGRSGRSFRGRNSAIFEHFRSARTCCAYFVRCPRNTIKTDAKRTSVLSRDDTKTSKNRSASAFDGARCSKHAWTVLRAGLRASAGRPGDAFDRLLLAPGPSRTPQDRPWGGLWASKSCPERVRTSPKRVRTRPWNGFGRPKWPGIDFSSIFGRFRDDFRRSSTDLASNFR